MSDTLKPYPDKKCDTWLILLAATIFCVLSVWMAVASRGFLEADSITHYLARRFAFDQPLHMVGIWTRPFCVMLYALPAKFGGLIGTRLMSLVLVMVLLVVLLLVNRRQQLARPAFVAIFLLTQPLLFAHSFSELTEIPFALLLLCAFWAYQRKAFLLLAIIAAISPLARPEGFGLLGVVAMTLVLHKRWWWAFLLPAGLLGWSWLGWHVYGGPSEYPWYRWLPMNWPYSGDSMYGRGSPFWLTIILPAVIGPMAFPLVWIGAYRSLTEGLPDQSAKASADLSQVNPGIIGKFFSDHDYRCRALIALIPMGILVGHSLLWTFGKMASNGEPRYLLIVSPFWALLAAIGWGWVSNHLSIKRPVAWTAFAAIIPIAANIYYPAFPIKPADDDRLAEKIDEWIEQQPELLARYPKFAASLPHIFILLDRDRLDKANVVDSSRAIVSNPPPGVMLVWDPIYSAFNSNAEYVVSEQMLVEHGWRPLAKIEEKSRYAIIYVSPAELPGK